MKHLIPMTHKRDTKGTHFYEASDPTAAVKSMYIKRDAVTGDCPKTIMVTVEAVSE